MEEENRNLAKDMKDELIQEEKYYENVKIELSRISLINVLVEEVQKQSENSTDSINEYNLYIKFNNENIKIATIDSNGKLKPNTEILNDEKYTDEDKRKLGDMLNLLGLEQEKIDLNKLKENLKQIEAKTKEEIEHDGKENATIKDDNERTEEKGDKEDERDGEEEKDLAEIEQEGEQETIAKKKHLEPKKVCKIRRDSQFYKNYPNIPKTAYFYLDSNDRIHAEYIDKDGAIQELKGFNEIKDRPNVTSFGNDGKNIEDKTPFRVMSAEGLEDKNHNTQSVRIAMYIDTYGYLKIETIHQGRNGEWEGKPIDVYGKEKNTRRMNKIIDERYRSPKTGVIAARHEELKKSGFSEDGITLDELSKRRKINEYMEDGYSFEDANSIYDYVVGKLQLREEDAKLKVDEEIAEKKDNEERKSGGRDIGEEAWERLNNRH